MTPWRQINNNLDKKHREQTCRGGGERRGSANFSLPLPLNHGSSSFFVSSPLLLLLDCEILCNFVHFSNSPASCHFGHHDGATGNTQQVVRFFIASFDFLVLICLLVLLFFSEEKPAIIFDRISYAYKLSSYPFGYLWYECLNCKSLYRKFNILKCTEMTAVDLSPLNALRPYKSPIHKCTRPRNWGIHFYFFFC